MKRKIAAIMAADVAEYTRLVAEDEEEALARLAAYRLVFDDFVARAGGRVFNAAGDSVMCEFPSAVEATRCAIDIQESLRTRNLAYPPGRQMRFRIGISIGDVVDRDGDLLGDGVNIASRLQSLAEPGSVCVARNVQEAVANKISVPFRDLGRRDVKNLPHPVHAFQIEVGAMAAGAASPGAGARLSRFLKRAAVPSSVGWLATGIVIAAGGAGLYWLGREEQAKAPITVVALMPNPPATDQPRAAGETAAPDARPQPPPVERPPTSEGAGRAARGLVELYDDARGFEARGDVANARRDYLALAPLAGDRIDPLLRFAALVRAQDGRASAREVFAEIARGQGRAARLVHALQFEGAEQIRRLAALADLDPDYAPVHAMLALAYGEDRQNTQTIGDMRREHAALERFLAADREGVLVPFFLDQGVLAQWLDRARNRDEALRTFFAEGRDQVTARFSWTNAGWLASIAPPEPTTSLEYRIGGAGEFRSTGLHQVADPRTGRPMPNPSFTFAPNTGPTDVAIRYIDAHGARSAISTIAFDPTRALARGMRDNLERAPEAWLAFVGSGAGTRLVFTQLASHRCGIEKVEIGFDGEDPRRPVPLPPCDPVNPHAVPVAALPRVDLGRGVRAVSLRLTFVGGERSDVRTFARPD
mgnify:CR=1 FL=1